MFYQDLYDLFRHSRSTRHYFLSLPVALQKQLSAHSAAIHTAADLREAVRLVEKYNRAVALSESLFNP